MLHFTAVLGEFFFCVKCGCGGYTVVGLYSV